LVPLKFGRDRGGGEKKNARCAIVKGKERVYISLGVREVKEKERPLRVRPKRGGGVSATFLRNEEKRGKKGEATSTHYRTSSGEGKSQGGEILLHLLFGRNKKEGENAPSLFKNSRGS